MGANGLESGTSSEEPIQQGVGGRDRSGCGAISVSGLGRLESLVGINPLERLNYTTGISALNLLVLTLAATPLRRLLSYVMLLKALRMASGYLIGMR